MSKFLPALTAILFFSVVFLALIYLFQTDRLSNPFKDLEPENVVLSTVVGTINNLLGDVPESHLEDENKSLEEEFADSGYPAELFSFDVTAKKAVFAILSVDSSKKTMLLRYVFPFERNGKTIESVIACPVSDSIVVTYDPVTRVTETTQAPKPIYEIANGGTDTLLGICSDNECSSIVAECELAKTKRRYQ